MMRYANWIMYEANNIVRFEFEYTQSFEHIELEWKGIIVFWNREKDTFYWIRLNNRYNIAFNIIYAKSFERLNLMLLSLL